MILNEEFSILHGLLISFLMCVLASEFFGLFWLAGTLDHRDRVRVMQIRHLVIRLLLQSDAAPGAESSPRRVWAELARIVASEAGVAPMEILPEQRFSDLPDYC